MSDDPQRLDIRRRWRPSVALLRGGARGVSAVIAGVAGLAIIAAASLSTTPLWRSGAPDIVVDPVPAAEERVCAGPALRLGGTSGSEATVATSAGRPVVVSKASPGDVDRAPLGSTDNQAGIAPDLLTLPPNGVSGSNEPQLAGSQTEAINAGTFAGFAAADCLEASGDAWLSAGATTVGRTSLISIINPSSVDASVDLTIWGPAGEISAPGTSGIIIPPGAQRVYPLAGFAPGLESTVVRVQSRGGPIVATMHESIVRTLAAGGVEIAGPTRGPATTTTVPGVVVTGADTVTAASAAVGFDDLGTIIRFLNPGTRAATAVVTITRASVASTATSAPATAAQATPDPTTSVIDAPASSPNDISFTVSLEPGVVQDLSVPGLVDGIYTVKVESTAPITASVRVSTITSDGRADFAWMASADVLADRSLVAIAPGPSPILTLANCTGEAVSVTVRSGDADQVIEIAPQASVAIAVTSGKPLEFTGIKGVAASVGYNGPGELASFVVSRPAESSTAVRVYR